MLCWLVLRFFAALHRCGQAAVSPPIISLSWKCIVEHFCQIGLKTHLFSLSWINKTIIFYVFWRNRPQTYEKKRNQKKKKSVELIFDFFVSIEKVEYLESRNWSRPFCCFEILLLYEKNRKIEVASSSIFESIWEFEMICVLKAISRSFCSDACSYFALVALESLQDACVE